MNDLSNKYALAALKERRASIAGLITETEARLVRMRQDLAHVDGTLRMFSNIEPGSIAPKKPYKRVMLFGHGELNRLIFSAMRKGDGRPMSVPEIAAGVVEELGHGEDAAKGMVRRVRANLQYLARDRGLIRKYGERREAKWSLTEA
jgi:hypothetical protein